MKSMGDFLIGLSLGTVVMVALAVPTLHKEQLREKAALVQVKDLQTQVSRFQIAVKANQDAAKYRTLLISQFAEVPHRDFTGMADPWSHLDISFMPGTVWVIPGLVIPRTLMPDQRAAFATLDPQGHVTPAGWRTVPAIQNLNGTPGDAQ